MKEIKYVIVCKASELLVKIKEQEGEQNGK